MSAGPIPRLSLSAAADNVRYQAEGALAVVDDGVTVVAWDSRQWPGLSPATDVLDITVKIRALSDIPQARRIVCSPGSTSHRNGWHQLRGCRRLLAAGDD